VSFPKEFFNEAGLSLEVVRRLARAYLDLFELAAFLRFALLPLFFVEFVTVFVEAHYSRNRRIRVRGDFYQI
jgi:hypothetical protein